MEAEDLKDVSSSRRFLPGVIAFGALVVYGVTLNHWHSLQSLTPATMALGVDWWSHKVGHPLLYLVAAPLRWLSSGIQVVALNAVSAVAAGLVLALLARTVALLPQDRTQDQRLRNLNEKGLMPRPYDWLPPIFAVLVCGLQMTFWEHATAATGEMLYLLPFAFVIWCLAEYRIDRREVRLRLAFVAYGAGMATNWAMVGFLPLFVVALLWLKGLAFFRWRFLLSSLGMLLLGMLFYLYDPLMAALDPGEPTGFWQMLSFEVATQRNPLLGYPKGRVIMLSVTSVLPLALVAIRWPSNFGDVSGFGVALASLLFRLVHLVFFAAIVWVAFDPAFSPRALGYGLPMLTLYYLGALLAGYLLGYFLVIGGGEVVAKWRRGGFWERISCKILFFGAWVVVLAAPVLLIRQNLPRIRVENGDLLRRFAGQLAAPLTKDGALVLGTDTLRLQLLNAWHHGREGGILIASLPDLGRPRFHKRAAAAFPKQWPDPGDIEGAEPISSTSVTRFLAGMSRLHPLWAVDGIPGTLLLESLRAEPRGTVFQLIPIGEGENPILSFRPDRLGWESDREHVEAVLESLMEAVSSGAEAGLVVGRQYSAWVNGMGVRAQEAGDLAGAGWAFETARRLNPENVGARVNADVNVLLAEGKPGVSDESESLQQELAEVRSWSNLLRRDGPIDESRVRTFFGELLIGHQMHRQALRELNRALELNPTNVVARLDFARACYEIGLHTNALGSIAPLREVETDALSPNVLSELERLTALCEFRLGDVDGAESRLIGARARDAGYLPLGDALVTIYIETERFTNALAVLESQLERQPGYRRARFNLGPVYAQLGRNDEAIAALSDLLRTETNNGSLYANRGNVYLKTSRWTEAGSDFHRAIEIRYHSPSVYQGLGEVALSQGRTNAAVGHWETALRLFPTGSVEGVRLQQRLESITAGASPSGNP